MIAILGASGNVGSKIANQLLNRNEAIRVVGRHLGRLMPFTSKGAEARVGDISDPDFLVEVFKDCDAAFVMIPPNPGAHSLMLHYRKISEALVQAIQLAGLRHVVNLSSVGAEHEKRTGPIKYLHDHERRLNALPGVNVLHLRSAFFMENLLANIHSIQSEGVMSGGIRGDVSLAMIATRDIADFAAKRLASRDAYGKNIHFLLGERDLTFNEVAAILSKTLGQSIQYITFDASAMRTAFSEVGFSRDVADQMVEMGEAFNSGLITTKGLRSPMTSTPTSFEEFSKVFRDLVAAQRVA